MFKCTYKQLTVAIATTIIALTIPTGLAQSADKTPPVVSTPYGKDDPRPSFYDKDAETSSWLPKFEADTNCFIDPVVVDKVIIYPSEVPDLQDRLTQASNKSNLNFYFVWTMLGAKDRDSWEMRGSRYSYKYQRNSEEIAQGKIERLLGVWLSDQSIGFEPKEAVIIMAITSPASGGTIMDVHFGPRAQKLGMNYEALHAEGGILEKVRRSGVSVPNKIATLAEQLVNNIPEFKAQKAAADKLQAQQEAQFQALAWKVAQYTPVGLFALFCLAAIKNAIRKNSKLRKSKTDAETRLALTRKLLDETETTYKEQMSKSVVEKYSRNSSEVSTLQAKQIAEALNDLKEAVRLQSIVTVICDNQQAALALPKRTTEDYERIVNSLTTQTINLASFTSAGENSSETNSTPNYVRVYEAVDLMTVLCAKARITITAVENRKQ